jgi:hypothetical protein
MAPYLTLLLALCLGLLSACSLLAPEASFAPTHPEKLGPGRPLCSDCHESELHSGARKPYASFDHTPAFLKNHGFAAGRDAGTCASCHGQSFCSDCHTGKTMIPPADLLGNRPDREVPHRMGYLSYHQIEGKVDPVRCYTCHGRANNQRCIACHR